MRMFVAAIAFLFPALAYAQEHPVLPSQEVSAGDSIYLLEGEFTDQHGKTVRLKDFEGKPVVVSMFYASCPHACPLLISDIKKVERDVPEKLRRDLRVVLVTFDPDRDTPAELRELGEAHRVDMSRWSFLRTDPDRVRELAALLGIRYRFGKDGSIGHSSVITLLDREGRIAARIDGLRQPNHDLVREATTLLEARK